MEEEQKVLQTHELAVDSDMVRKNPAKGCLDEFTGNVKEIATPKTETGIRDIPMSEKTRRALIEQKRLDMLLGRTGSIEIDGYSNFIFTNSKGKPFATNAFNCVLKNIVEAYNIKERKSAKWERRKPELLPHISAHILRHTACTRMAEANMDPKVLQKIMGHKDIAVTMNVYNHVDTDRLIKEMEKMENVM